MHVHVITADGEAKFWMDPGIALAWNYGLSEPVVNRAVKLVTERQEEIRDAWRKHFPQT